MFVVQRQEACPERRVADPPAGIDPRPDEKGEVIGRSRPVDARRQRQRRDPGVTRLPHDLEAAHHEGPVETLERHHVAHRRQRNEVDHAHEVGQSRAPPLTQQPVGRNQHHEGDPGSAEIAKPRNVIGTVGVDHRIGLGQPVVGQVVVDDQHIRTPRPGMRDWQRAGGAAIERHDQRRAALHQLVDGRNVGTVSLKDPVRDVDLGIEAEMPQIARHQRRGAGAVDVVVAEQANLLFRLDGVGQTRSQGIHRRQRRRVGHEVPERWLEVTLGLVGADPASGQDTRQNLGHLKALPDGGCDPRALGIEPVDPGATRHRALDIEEKRPQLLHGRQVGGKAGAVEGQRGRRVPKRAVFP